MRIAGNTFSLPFSASEDKLLKEEDEEKLFKWDLSPKVIMRVFKCII